MPPVGPDLVPLRSMWKLEKKKKLGFLMNLGVLRTDDSQELEPSPWTR